MGMALSIVVDIKTRVFDETDLAYRLFPGKAYRYYTTMRDHSVVFLDNPGIPLPSPAGYSKDRDTLEAICRSELKQSIVYADSNNIRADLAEVDAKDMGSVRWSKKRELSLGWLNTLYLAPAGTLIVIPSPGIIKDGEEWVRTKSLIGEIIGPAERWTRGAPPNIEAGRYVVRRVKWLAQVDEQELEAGAILSLRTQNVLVAMRAKIFQRSIGAAYKNIVLGNEFLARFTTTGAKFSAAESYHFNAFAMAVVAAMSASEVGKPALPANSSIYDIAASVPENDQHVPEQEASIHSPGYTTLRGLATIPAVISILFALALVPDAQPFAAEGPEQVEVVNSESTAYNPCEVGIEDSVRQSLVILGFERWQQMCQAARKANENEGLKSITTVETVDPAKARVPEPEHDDGGKQ